MAIENARLHEKVKELSLLEDRGRIARDLHDTVIQRLFATGLRMQGAARLAQRPEVIDGIVAAVDDLDATVKQIRTAIFGLEVSGRRGGGLRTRVLALTAETVDPLGFDPHVLFDGPLDTLPETVATEILAALREALTNVARHAGATRVDIEVRLDGDVVCRVVDGGRGLPAKLRAGGRGQHGRAGLGAGKQHARLPGYALRHRHRVASAGRSSGLSPVGAMSNGRRGAPAT